MAPNSIFNNEIPSKLTVLESEDGFIGCRGVKDLIAG